MDTQISEISTFPTPCCLHYTDFDSCAITGGSGMLGRALIRLLLAERKKIRVLDLLPVDLPHIEFIQGDIRDASLVDRVCQNVDVVFHAAAAVWNPRTRASLYDEVNVLGTENIIRACQKWGIPKLIFTSSMDVVVDGAKPIVYGDESLPYPPKMPKDPYSRSKIVAEQLILRANSPRLHTCALRPVGMYGPHDKYHVPNILEMAFKGNKMRLGNGSAKFSHVYATNVAHAHILAAKHMMNGSPVCGNAYFITDHQPADNLFDFMDPFLASLNLPIPSIRIPYKMAFVLAAIAEKIAPFSNFNRFSVIQTCVDHSFNGEKAGRDMCYEPIVTKAEAIAETMEWVFDTWGTAGSKSVKVKNATTGVNTLQMS